MTPGCDKHQSRRPVQHGEALEILGAQPKGQCTTSQLQTLTLGSSKGRADWTAAAKGESGVRGTGDRAGKEAIRSSLLRHSLRLQKPFVSGRSFTSKQL